MRCANDSSTHWKHVAPELRSVKASVGIRPRGVIFDLDGTLLDSLADIAAAMNSALRIHGYATHDPSAYRTFVGDGVEALARRALPQSDRSDVVVASCVAAMRAAYAVDWNVHTRPYDGIPEALDALVAADVPISVLSNKPHDMTVRLVNALLDRWTFVRIDGARPGVPHKPDASTAIDICRTMRVEPSEVVYVGDTDTDMKTAVAAGMYAVGVLWGFREGDELLAAGARKLIAAPSQLPPLFG